MIETPEKIVCVGLNYRDHAEEQGVDLPERPLLFAKWPNTLIADGDAIRIPEISKQVDYEAELGVVIGRPAGEGAFRKPQVWLKPGDESTSEIDGLGSITNPVVAAD